MPPVCGARFLHVVAPRSIVPVSGPATEQVGSIEREKSRGARADRVAGSHRQSHRRRQNVGSQNSIGPRLRPKGGHGQRKALVSAFPAITATPSPSGLAQFMLMWTEVGIFGAVHANPKQTHQ